MNLIPRFNPGQVRVHPYFLRASPDVIALFEAARHPVKNLGFSKYDLRALPRIARLCDEHRIDVMHLFCYAASTLGRLVGKAKGIPTVIHDFETQAYFPYPTYLRVMDRVLARSTGRALASSLVCRDYMREVRAVPEERIEVLYHAIPSDQLQARRRLDREAARRRLQVGNDEFLFTAVTKLGPDRGNEVLLTAFARVRERIPAARLALVYKTTRYHRMPKEYERIEWARDPAQMFQRVATLIDQLGLNDTVLFAEALEHPELYYSASDVLVAPFESTRFSSVNLVEAMAHGRPHIVTDLGEPAELVDRYQSGVKVRVGDATSLAEAMAALATDPRRLAQLSENARRAATDSTVDAVAGRMARLYSSLVDVRVGAAAIHAVGSR
jgi:glycosyltransferase involved in cell wall biosynthesis